MSVIVTPSAKIIPSHVPASKILRTEWGADWAAVPNRITLYRLPLEEAPRGYEMFLKKEDGCRKVVLVPEGA